MCRRRSAGRTVSWPIKTRRLRPPVLGKHTERNPDRLPQLRRGSAAVSANANRPFCGRVSLRRCMLASALASALLLAVAAPAFAVQVTEHDFYSGFTGAQSTAGRFGAGSIRSIATNEENNNVFVLSSEQRVLDQFDETGNPISYSGENRSGTSSLPLEGYGRGQVAIDNSANAEVVAASTSRANRISLPLTPMANRLKAAIRTNRSTDHTARRLNPVREITGSPGD